MNKSVRGVLAVLVAGCFWGITGLFVKYFESIGIDSLQMVFLRMLVTAGVLLIGLLLFRPKLLRIRLEDSWCFLGNGIFSLLMFSLCYFQAIQLSSMAVAAVLMYTAPIIVMILSLFLFRERMTWLKSIACGLSFAGCVFVAGLLGNAEPVSMPALLTGLGSGLGYALYSIFSRYAINKGYHTLTILTYSFTVAFIGTIPFTDISATFQALQGRPVAILMIVLMGLVSAVFPYLLYTYGLTRIESSRASIIASVEPVVATIVGILIFHEVLDFGGIIGIVLVLSALVLLNFKQLPKIKRSISKEEG